MIGFNGGLIGVPRVPSGNQSTPGVWTINEQSEYAAIPGFAEWPEAMFIIGTQASPMTSPAQAAANNPTPGKSGYAWIKSTAMSVAILMEYQEGYYENKPWVCAFRSGFGLAATINHLNKSIPMSGLLVQRDSLDIRAAVYWNTTQTYSTTTGLTADSGYSPRKVMLGYAGGHGIYNTGQNPCGWSSSTGSIGAGYDGNCGTFPDGLKWGTGTASANYANMSGTWSHWLHWA